MHHPYGFQGNIQLVGKCYTSQIHHRWNELFSWYMNHLQQISKSLQPGIKYYHSVILLLILWYFFRLLIQIGNNFFGKSITVGQLVTWLQLSYKSSKTRNDTVGLQVSMLANANVAAFARGWLLSHWIALGKSNNFLHTPTLLR